MDLKLHRLILFAVFSILNKAFTVTNCNNPTHRIFQGVPKPPPILDCSIISSHLPTLPNHPDESRDPNRRRSPDSPFFPQAILRHGECLARVTYFSRLHTPGDFGPALDYLHEEEGSTPEAPLSEQSVFNMWATIRTGIESITNECLVNDQTGMAWDYVDVPEISRAWIAVEVLGTAMSQGWRGTAWAALGWIDETREQQLAALRGLRVDQKTNLIVPNMFRLSNLDVS